MTAMSTQARAAALMLGSTVFFSMMVLSIRLASQTLDSFEIAFFRNFFGLAALLPLLRGRLRQTLRTSQLPLYLLRSVIGLASMLCGFWAISHLPLAQAISLSYSTPLFVTIAAVLLLHEQVRARRWAAVSIGFIGVLVIVRPGSVEFSLGTLVALIAAILSAIVAIQIKQLSRNDGADTIVLWTYLFWVPISLVPALVVWQWPQGIAWLWVVAVGVFGTGGQLLWTRALKLGDVSALTPISFMQLPIVAVFGWLMFDEDVDRWVILGAIIIFSANAYIAHREAVLARRSRSNAPVEAAKPGE